jgi:hypothetical protein
MKRSSIWLGISLALLALTAASCSDPTGDGGGLDMRSRGTGERNERLGNDPAEQNTGAGSTREEEPQPNPEPNSQPNPQPNPQP